MWLEYFSLRTSKMGISFMQPAHQVAQTSTYKNFHFKSSKDDKIYDATIDQLQLYALGYKALTGTNADFLEIYVERFGRAVHLLPSGIFSEYL